MIFSVRANVIVERKLLTTIDLGKFLNSLSIGFLFCENGDFHETRNREDCL